MARDYKKAKADNADEEETITERQTIHYEPISRFLQWKVSQKQQKKPLRLFNPQVPLFKGKEIQ